MSCTALVLTGPLVLCIGIVVKLTSGKPILFRQRRPGLGGVPFTIFKFRSMREGFSHDPHEQKRTSRFGSFLRRTSLDELPELWNVLRGDMSLVGPRPLLMQYLDRYTPEQRRRHEVLPGLTGWAQIHGRNAIDWDKRLALDIWYVDHQSFWLDLKILLQTVLQVIAGRGVNHSREITMPEFRQSAVLRE